MTENLDTCVESVETAPVVHVVDSDAELRESLSRLLLSIGLCVHEHTSAEGFLSEYDPTIPGCVLSDVYLPGMSGLALQSQLTERQLAIPFLILTSNADIPMAVDTMSRGAHGFLLKPPRNHEIIELIQKAIRFDQAHRQEELHRQNLAARFSQLTDREKEVLDRVLAGASNKGVAALLGISYRTVETHRAHIMHKLGVHSLAGFYDISFQYRTIRDSHRRDL